LKNFLSRLHGSVYYFNSLIPGLKPLRAYINWLRANYDMFRQQEEVKAKPLKLTIEPTNMCHLKCPLCPTGLGIAERDFCELDIDLLKRLIDELGDYIFFVDLFNWGEPLFSKNLEEFLRILNKKHISTTISTNLSVKISEERIKKIISSGLNHIIVSLDGASKDSYNEYRRGGNFDLVIENMKRFVAIRDKINSNTPYITWQFLIFRFNEHEINKAQRMAKEIGVDRIWFQRACLDEGDFKISEKDRIIIRKWIPSDPSLTFYDPKDAEVHYTEPLRALNKVRLKRCDWHYISSAINSDGNISPCCGLYKKSDDMGYLDSSRENSYMKEINNDNYKRLRNAFAGRCALPEDITCSQCINGSLMAYATGINRWILFITIAKIMHYFIQPFYYLSGKNKRPKLKVKWPD